MPTMVSNLLRGVRNMPVQLEQPTESPMMTSQENPMLTEDNRILAPGITRELEY